MSCALVGLSAEVFRPFPASVAAPSTGSTSQTRITQDASLQKIKARFIQLLDSCLQGLLDVVILLDKTMKHGTQTFTDSMVTAMLDIKH